MKRIKKRRADGVIQRYWVKNRGAGYGKMELVMVLDPNVIKLRKIESGKIKGKEAEKYLKKNFNPAIFGEKVPKNKKTYASDLLKSYEEIV